LQLPLLLRSSSGKSSSKDEGEPDHSDSPSRRDEKTNDHPALVSGSVRQNFSHSVRKGDADEKERHQAEKGMETPEV